MEIMINIAIAVISILITWWIAHLYYKKSLSDQAAQWEKVESKFLSKLDEVSPKDELVLYEQRINSAIQDYRRKGTPKYIIDTFDDLTFAQKEKMYDDVLLRVKGRKGKNNPYAQSSN